MILKKHDDAIGKFLQFSPYIFFFITYLILYIYSFYIKSSSHYSSTIIEKIPVVAAFLATIYAFFTCKNSLKIDKKIEVFLSGAGGIESMYGYFLIICITIFNHIMAKTNGTLIAITLGLLYIPNNLLMPMIFILASCISMIIASLPAAIIMLLPIGYGIALSFKCSSACMAATIISGALCGNHIMMYFNTIHIHTKFNIKNWLEQIKIAIVPVFIPMISTILLLSRYHCEPISSSIYQNLQSSLQLTDYVTIIPYLFLCITRFFGIDLLISFVTASFLSLILQAINHKIIFLDIIITIFDGFYTKTIIGNILLLHIILHGLTKLIQYNNGFNWVLEKLELKIYDKSLSTASAIILMTIVTKISMVIEIINTHSINYPMKTLESLHHLEKNKIKTLSNLIAITIQTIIPYGSILFFATLSNRCSYFDIMQYMIYPILGTILTLCLLKDNKIGLKD